MKKIPEIQHLLQNDETAREIYSHYLSNTEDFEIDYFESTQEHLLDTYSIRLQTAKRQKINIHGLEKLINKLKTNIYELINVVLLNGVNERLIIFANKKYKELISVIVL